MLYYIELKIFFPTLHSAMKKKKIKSFSIFSTKRNETSSHYQVNPKFFFTHPSHSKSDQLEEETTGLEKLSGDFRLFCFYFNKSIETNLPIQKNIQEN